MKKIIVLIVVILPLFTFSQNIMTLDNRREKTIQDIGDYAQYAPALASLVVIIAEKDKKGLWQFAKSQGTTLGLTYILKYTINKPRPDGATDGHAFPSGHTAEAFAGASFLQRRYGWKYGIPAYAVASYVAYSRLEGLNDRHDGWDILAGIVVGVGSTYLFTTPYQKEHLELSFKGAKGEFLMGVNYKF
uniref:phosphatase PAP2 family protein n=1 Tax=Mariniflexile sp. TaxID=1979402 RepID=UPI0040482C40